MRVCLKLLSNSQRRSWRFCVAWQRFGGYRGLSCRRHGADVFAKRRPPSVSPHALETSHLCWSYTSNNNSSVSIGQTYVLLTFTASQSSNPALQRTSQTVLIFPKQPPSSSNIHPHKDGNTRKSAALYLCVRGTRLMAFILTNVSRWNCLKSNDISSFVKHWQDGCLSITSWSVHRRSQTNQRAV